jgi:hypothetical protein
MLADRPIMARDLIRSYRELESRRRLIVAFDPITVP